MMKKMLSKLLRIDNLDRILVFVSMALFLTYPSIILYYTDEINQTYETIVKTIVMIGIVVGTGSMTLVRPIRTTLMYFIEVLIVLVIEFYDYTPKYLNININSKAVFWLEEIYCVIAIFINIIITMAYHRKKKAISATKEDTNEDTMYDFLNASDSNKKIESDLENITDDKIKGNIMKRRKQIKFSRFLRTTSFFFTFLTFTIYYIVQLQKNSYSADDTFFRLNLLALILILISFICSIRYPRDFKYLYFYNSALFLILSIICSKNYGLKPIFFIIVMIYVSVVFLFTLIVEGRTWTGSHSD